MNNITPVPLLILFLAATVSLNAWTFNNVDIHGFFDQGYLASTGNNYFGPTKDGTWHMTQAAINASTNINDRLRIGGEIYTFRLGDIGSLNRPQIDWLYADYHWKDSMSFRLGKVKQPKGLYGDSLDLEMTRPYIFLPQGVYAAAWRDFSGGLWGGSVYGTIPTRSHGSFDYNVTAGKLDIRSNSGLIDETSEGSFMKFHKADENYAIFTQLVWNTPTEGLKFVASADYARNLTFTGVFKSADELNIMAPPESSLAGAAALLSGAHSSLVLPSSFLLTLSTEYLWKKWTFAAEYYRMNVRYHTIVEDPAAAGIDPLLAGEVSIRRTIDAFYVSASRRINHNLELGAYYSMSFYDAHDRKANGFLNDGKQNYLGFQHDLALSARYDITPYWIVKVEGHLVDGTQATWFSQNQPWQDEKRNWTYGAIKSIFYF